MIRLMKPEIIPTVIEAFITALTLTVAWPNKTVNLVHAIDLTGSRTLLDHTRAGRTCALARI